MTTTLGPDATTFAHEWIEAWNAHDLDRVLVHYAPGVVFRSPVAARVRPDSGGVIVGKPALADYWHAALPLAPDLHFTLDEACPSVGGLTILYHNERGQQVAETLVFGEGPDEGLVVFGIAGYGAES